MFILTYTNENLIEQTITWLLICVSLIFEFVKVIPVIIAFYKNYVTIYSSENDFVVLGYQRFQWFYRMRFELIIFTFTCALVTSVVSFIKHTNWCPLETSVFCILKLFFSSSNQFLIVIFLSNIVVQNSKFPVSVIIDKCLYPY